MNQRPLIRLVFIMYLFTSSFSYRKRIKKIIKRTPPHRCLFRLSTLFHRPPTSSTRPALSPALAISLALTDTARRAGLPVVSIFHLDAGDSALPLQFITWITREGHRVARLPTFPVASAIHRNTRISAGRSQWTWRANTQTHRLRHIHMHCASASFTRRLICCRQLSTRSSEVAPTAADCCASIWIRRRRFFVYCVIFQIIMDFIELTLWIWSINGDINCSAVKKWCSALTGEVNGEAGLGDIKICLKLNGDDVESRMNPIRKQRAAHFLQWHFLLWRPIPNLQDVVGRLRVECKKLQTGKIRPRQIITWS